MGAPISACLFSLINKVNTPPIIPEISIFENCETDGSANADFIFNEKDDEITTSSLGINDRSVNKTQLLPTNGREVLDPS